MTYICFSRKEKCVRDTKGIATFNLVVIVSFFVLIVLFLVQSSSLVSKNYQLRSYQDLLSQKQELVQKLEIKQIEGDSLNNLHEMAKKLNLVSIDKIKYLENPQNSVALLKNLNP